jgi:hypothetical protein
MRHLSFLRRTLPASSVMVALFLAAGCTNMQGSGKSSSGTSSTATVGASSSAGATGAPATYTPVSDVPIPPGTKINTERSFILGGPDRWFGKISLVLDRTSTLAYAYFVDQMPTFGWEAVMATQGKVSSLTYVRGDRTALIEIEPATLRGSDVVITVSPRPPAPATAAPAKK